MATSEKWEFYCESFYGVRCRRAPSCYFACYIFIYSLLESACSSIVFDEFVGRISRASCAIRSADVILFRSSVTESSLEKEHSISGMNPLHLHLDKRISFGAHVKEIVTMN